MLQISRQKISGKNFFVDTLKKVKKERGGVFFYLEAIVENICQYEGYGGKFF
jgi:hypothetical protein